MKPSHSICVIYAITNITINSLNVLKKKQDLQSLFKSEYHVAKHFG